MAAREIQNRIRVSVYDLKAAFADHAGCLTSICEDEPDEDCKTGIYGAADGESVTVASVIYDVNKLDMHVCKGNPCSGSWECVLVGSIQTGGLVLRYKGMIQNPFNY